MRRRESGQFTTPYLERVLGSNLQLVAEFLGQPGDTRRQGATGSGLDVGACPWTTALLCERTNHRCSQGHPWHNFKL